MPIRAQYQGSVPKSTRGPEASCCRRHTLRRQVSKPRDLGLVQTRLSEEACSSPAKSLLLASEERASRLRGDCSSPAKSVLLVCEEPAPRQRRASSSSIHDRPCTAVLKGACVSTAGRHEWRGFAPAISKEWSLLYRKTRRLICGLLVLPPQKATYYFPSFTSPDGRPSLDCGGVNGTNGAWAWAWAWAWYNLQHLIIMNI